MAKDNQVLLRLNDPQFEAFKDFAEDRDYNDAEAAREIVKSRLSGEGYLDYPVTDGGQLVQEIEKTRKAVDGQSERIEEQSEKIESVQDYLSLTLLLSLIWLGVHLAFSIPSEATIVTGGILITGLSYVYIRYLRE